MAAEAEIEDGEGSDAKGKKKLPLMLIAGAVAFLLIGGGAAAYFFFAGSGGQSADAARLAGAHDTFIFNLPPMTVNLKSEGDGEAFMKLTIALEVADEKMMAEIQPRMAKVVDAFQVYLRELRKSDLEGSAGVYRLKEELRRRVNVAIFPAQVDSILFKEILVQ
ncbi:MAG TPA: flagellar basal body-associated FliL family protein [Devosia sp.]